MAYKYSFEKLEVYGITNSFPDKEKFGLSSQLQRASVSVVSNIAEGISRNSNKEKMRFLEMSYGSLMEVYCQLHIAVNLTYISEDKLFEIKELIDKIANKLNALTRPFQKRIPN
ncbi:MAG: four helix bundle protein [Candidatus Delongbacteria bacterium]|nr:four helix bundle protein [Candidatus Delongbacteria bacterium]